MGHRSVGPEHLLLGLLRDDRGPAIEALEAVGVSFAATRREVRRLYGDPEDGNGQDTGKPATEAPISDRARGTLEQALAEAGRRSEAHLGVEHILAALLRDVPGGAVRALAALGVTALDVWQELARCTGWSGAREGTSARRPSTEEGERSVTDEERPEKLSEEELDAQIGAALPDREVMSILPLLDPTDGVAIPILHHPPDPQPDPPPDDPETTTPD